MNVIFIFFENVFKFLNQIPTYNFSDIFNVNIETIGYISGIPMLAEVIGIIFWCSIADYIRSNELLSIQTVRTYQKCIIKDRISVKGYRNDQLHTPADLNKKLNIMFNFKRNHIKIKQNDFLFYICDLHAFTFKFGIKLIYRGIAQFLKLRVILFQRRPFFHKNVSE